MLQEMFPAHVIKRSFAVNGAHGSSTIKKYVQNHENSEIPKNALTKTAHLRIMKLIKGFRVRKQRTCRKGALI